MSNKIDNITESCKFAMSQLLSKPVDAELIKIVSDYNKEGCSEDDKKDLVESAINKTPEWAAEECNSFGVNNILDTVELNVSLGSVIYDLYRQSVILPKAPLALALFKRKDSDYAEVLGSDSFVVPNEVSSSAQKILLDDNLWANCVVSAYAIKGEDEKIYMTLNGNGLIRYRKILAGLMSVFLPLTK